LNKQTFIQLITHPSEISAEQLLDLEKVAAGFPYCQATYILIAKQAEENGSMFADQKLKKAAAYTLDRKNLKRILSSPKKEFTFSDIPKQSTATLDETENPVQPTNLPIKEVEIIEDKNLSLPPLEEKKELPSNLPLSPKEPLTDAQRDKIIQEIQDNLKKLHYNKIKSAWEDVPEEIHVIGVSPTLPIETKEKESIVENTNIEEDSFSPIETTESLLTKPESDEKEINTLKSSDNKSSADFLLEADKDSDLEPTITFQLTTSYPIRMEDVAVEESNEHESSSNLLLEYLDFLEEKRSVFRKNKKKEGEIINKIIKEDPSIPKLDIHNLPDNSVDLSSKSSSISKVPVSENFAKILTLQGKREKAIEIYEQLILKNPEKKPYFEAQIEKLKNRI
jgi:hypothetical protein